MSRRVLSIARTFWWGRAVFGAILLSATSAWAGDPTATDLTPDRAVSLALTAHVEVRAAEAVLMAAEADRSASLLLLRNPKVQAWATLDGSRAELSATQPLSLTGEGWHARGVARSSVRSAEAALERARRVTAADVRLSYIDAVVAIEQARVAQEGTELAGRLRYAVGRKLEQGEASALDLRLARLAEAQAVTRLLEAREAEAEALQELAELLAIPVDAADLLLDPGAAAPAVTSSSNPDDRSDVVAAEHALRAARAELARQRAAVLPPVGVGVGVMVEDGATFIGPSVGVTIPLFDRNQRGTKAAKGDHLVAESQLSAVRARAETEQRTGGDRAAEAERLAEVVGSDALEEAAAALVSVERGVLTGEIDVTTAVLLQAQILDGEAAIVSLRGLVADARIDLLLALDDDALLGGGR
ncbi:MAG: TolC family protein [Proteobacteria bacterium]|nr:TolC family protein [Pseudomonadota bacterium]